MDGILHWVGMLAGKPSHFFSESITTDLIFNTLTRISTDKAFSLFLSISPVMDTATTVRGRDLENRFFFLGDFSPNQPSASALWKS